MTIVTSEYLQYVIVPQRDEDSQSLTPVITRHTLPRARRTNIKRNTRIVEISYEHLEAAIISHLHAFKVIQPDEEVLWTDIDIALNENGLIEIELGVGPVEKQLKLPLGSDPLGR